MYIVQGNASGPPSEVIDLMHEIEDKLVLCSKAQHPTAGGGTCESSLHQQHGHVGFCDSCANKVLASGQDSASVSGAADEREFLEPQQNDIYGRCAVCGRTLYIRFIMGRPDYDVLKCYICNNNMEEGLLQDKISSGLDEGCVHTRFYQSDNEELSTGISLRNEPEQYGIVLKGTSSGGASPKSDKPTTPEASPKMKTVDDDNQSVFEDRDILSSESDTAYIPEPVLIYKNQRLANRTIYTEQGGLIWRPPTVPTESVTQTAPVCVKKCARKSVNMHEVCAIVSQVHTESTPIAAM
jgi:hypothetical protein